MHTMFICQMKPTYEIYIAKEQPLLPNTFRFHTPICIYVPIDIVYHRLTLQSELEYFLKFNV